MARCLFLSIGVTGFCLGVTGFSIGLSLIRSPLENSKRVFGAGLVGAGQILTIQSGIILSQLICQENSAWTARMCLRNIAYLTLGTLVNTICVMSAFSPGPEGQNKAGGTLIIGGVLVGLALANMQSIRAYFHQENQQPGDPEAVRLLQEGADVL